jgi:hypothetical protein
MSQLGYFQMDNAPKHNTMMREVAASNYSLYVYSLLIIIVI